MLHRVLASICWRLCAAALGQGNQGKVYRCRFTRLAFKEHHNSSQVSFEAANIMSLPSNPNILPILGLVKLGSDSGEAFTFYPFMPRGSLDKFITKKSFTWSERIPILRGIASGLVYLHENGILHLDIKPENIMLDDNLVPKIGDFGCCEKAGQAEIIKRGTTRYMAPEVGRAAPTEKCDVFSFGILALEVIRGRRLSANELPVSAADPSFFCKDRSFKPDEAEIVELMIRGCLQSDAVQRPSMMRTCLATMPL